MTFTIETLSACIRNARAQEEQHRANMNAASGAIQAYEQLLTELVQAQRKAAAQKDVPAIPLPVIVPTPVKKVLKKSKK